MRVLVTGGAGFIGHRVILELLKRTDYEVISLDRLDVSGTLDRLAYVRDEVGPEVAQRLKIVWHDMKAPLNSFTKAQINEPNIILHTLELVRT